MYIIETENIKKNA